MWYYEDLVSCFSFVWWLLLSCLQFATETMVGCLLPNIAVLGLLQLGFPHSVLCVFLLPVSLGCPLCNLVSVYIKIILLSFMLSVSCSYHQISLIPKSHRQIDFNSTGLATIHGKLTDFSQKKVKPYLQWIHPSPTFRKLPYLSSAMGSHKAHLTHDSHSWICIYGQRFKYTWLPTSSGTNQGDILGVFAVVIKQALTVPGRSGTLNWQFWEKKLSSLSTLIRMGRAPRPFWP